MKLFFNLVALDMSHEKLESKIQLFHFSSCSSIGNQDISN